MSRPSKTRGNQRRRPKAKPAAPVDLWRTPEPLGPFEPIVVPAEVGAVVRSLGDPPMNNPVAAGHYFNSVVERAAGVALALALSADAVAQPDET